MLRRYYANTRWEADWPLEMISQALGHKHLDTTIRYLNVLDDKLKTASQEFYRRYSKLYGVEQFWKAGGEDRCRQEGCLLGSRKNNGHQVKNGKEDRRTEPGIR